MPRSVNTEISFESWPTFSQTISSTSDASAASVSPSNAAATSRFTPILRACSANIRGSERFPAIIPRDSMESMSAQVTGNPTFRNTGLNGWNYQNDRAQRLNHTPPEHFKVTPGAEAENHHCIERNFFNRQLMQKRFPFFLLRYFSVVSVSLSNLWAG